MNSGNKKPLIGVTSSLMQIAGSQNLAHGAGRRYIESLVNFCDCVPLQIPALGDDYDYPDLVSRLDGVLLTGGRANVEPHHYGGPPFPDDEPIDPARDATVLNLIPACIEAEVPIFGVCRGIQEMNVALGGSLHYRINELPGKLDHRMPRGENVTPEMVYALRHSIALTQGGYFAGLIDADDCMINTLHGQGIDRLADDLEIEAVSEDGIIEGVRLKNDKTFTVGVQWHTEWKPEEHELSLKLYQEFAKSARLRAANRD